MSEEYREYKRRRTTNNHKPTKKFHFPKKLGFQAAISLVLLISIYILNFSIKENSINTYIKSAVLYQPDTSELADIFENILNLYTKEGNNNEKNTITKNL